MGFAESQGLFEEIVRILALETSAVSGSVALLDGDQVLAEHSLGREQKTAAFLVPAIQQVLQKADWRTTDIQLVAVTRGPGSFTGLRVGVATAKTFAYAIQAEVLGVDTLEVLADQAAREAEVRGTIRPVMDAQRRQLFAAEYHALDNGSHGSQAHIEVKQTCRIVDRQPWLASLAEGSIVTGPVLGKLQSELEGLEERVIVVDESHWQPTARSVGLLAWTHYQAGRRDDLWKLVPDYYRRSAAEEKRELDQQSNASS